MALRFTGSNTGVSAGVLRALSDDIPGCKVVVGNPTCTNWLLTDWFGVKLGVNIGIEGTPEIIELATEYDGTEGTEMEWTVLNEAMLRLLALLPMLTLFISNDGRFPIGGGGPSSQLFP